MRFAYNLFEWLRFVGVYLIFFIFMLFNVGLGNILADPVSSVSSPSDIVIQGDVLKFDTEKNMTVAESPDSLSTVVWTVGVTHKTLYAKKITAFLVNDKHSKKDKVAFKESSIPLTSSIQAIKAQGEVRVVFEEVREENENAKITHTLHASFCESLGRQIICTGVVDLVMGQNKASGTKAVFNLESETLELTAIKGDKVSAVIYSKRLLS